MPVRVYANNLIVEVLPLVGKVGIPLSKAANDARDVRQIQRLLKQVMDNGHLNRFPIIEHGNFDTNTLQALKQFQQRYRLSSRIPGEYLVESYDPTHKLLTELSETPKLPEVVKPVAKVMSTGDAGVALIKSYEKLALNMYDNDGGNNCTIGYGHLLHLGFCTQADRNRYPNGITESEADRLLRQDLAKAETIVHQFVKVPLTQNQFDALVSLVFNTGGAKFGESQIVNKLNQGKYDEAGKELLKWNKANVNNKVVELRGLTRRRQEEFNLFMKK